MQRKQKIDKAPPKIVVQYSIQAKSAEYIFCPSNAIQGEFYERNPYVVPEFVTNDGASHQVKFIGTWNNRNGAYEDEFEIICQRYYGMTFEGIRSMWIGRLGRVDDYWHLIKLS